MIEQVKIYLDEKEKKMELKIAILKILVSRVQVRVKTNNIGDRVAWKILQDVLIPIAY